MKARLFLLCLVAVFSANGQSFRLHFDFSNAEQTLGWIENPSANQSTLDKLLQLPSTRVLQRKARVDSAQMRHALLYMHDSTLVKPAENRLLYSYIISTVKEQRRFLNQIKDRQDSLRALLEPVMSAYLPGGKNLDVTVSFVMGGPSSGFTMGTDSIFYIGLHFYQSDLKGIIETCRHELFHNIQRSVRDHFAYSNELEENGKDGLALVHYMLSHLFQEGSAEYVADLRKVNDPDAPYIRNMLKQALVNDGRSEDVFYLISKMLTDAATNPGLSQQENLYSILFDWNWNNPAYYAGYIMSKALCAEYGEDALKSFLARDPSDFVYEYILLTKRFPGKYPFRFTDAFAKLVGELRDEVKKIDLK